MISNQYIHELKETLDQINMVAIDKLVNILHRARMHRQRVFIMGNGGSASTASHLVCDLAKNTRKIGYPDFRVIGLADNMAVLSAYANDEGYENVFVNQLAALISGGDVVIGISTSGNSPNILSAIRVAKNYAETITVGFTGFDAGMLGSIVDLHIHVLSDCIEHVEDIHLIIGHLITKALREME